MILVLFTASYPYGTPTEQSFLQEEIRYLSSAFEKVILVPRHCEGQKLSTPQNVGVVDDYALFLKNPVKLFLLPYIFTSNIFYRDLSKHFGTLIHPRSFFRLITFLAGAYLTRAWVLRWLEQQDGNVQDYLFYTYWFDQVAMGIGLTRQIHPDLKLVSRAHGYDLYEERYIPPYWPGRRNALEAVDLLLPDSEAGTTYLQERYPEYRSKIETARLGVADPGFINLPSDDDTFRIVSCSTISPLKRVDLLLEGIACAARLRPGQKIEWHHFGNGQTRLEIQARADAEFPANGKACFPGYSTHQALMDFYRDNPIDLFFNVSTTEGTPVSIMEAISCGIPVVATSVGGNREIVTKENGILLPPNPSPQEIADTIFFVRDNPESIIPKRKESRTLWSEKYSAEKNFKAFIQRIQVVRRAEFEEDFRAA